MNFPNLTMPLRKSQDRECPNYLPPRDYVRSNPFTGFSQQCSMYQYLKFVPWIFKVNLQNSFQYMHNDRFLSRDVPSFSMKGPFISLNKSSSSFFSRLYERFPSPVTLPLLLLLFVTVIFLINVKVIICLHRRFNHTIHCCYGYVHLINKSIIFKDYIINKTVPFPLP